MRFQSLAGLVFGTVAIAVMACPAWAASDLDGTWKTTGYSGEDPKNSPFAGTMTLTQKGDHYDVSWKAPGDVGSGVGYVKTVRGGTRVLALGYVGEKGPAVALYEISEDGKTLKGDWVEDGFGHETLTR